ncbi:cell division protein FtsQ [Palleniella muris]|uniref:Cell division protein FtsQ n=1 Tax=Palleniella muris TaxID=3038145 RepID=A0AC61QUA6_9BACT|nr:cell division protein FtsQ [Palleniella muris]TGX84134.1 cell division protein FtsQ [Palleniella muris]
MKKYIIILIDIVLAVYLLLAVTAFNSPKELVKKCTKVNINITDESTYGFLDANEIKAILTKKGIYPLEQDLDKISPRKIESVLRNSPFVNTAECCKTTDGHVLIYVTQRSPLVRIKSRNGDDYYIDENGGIMPNSKYTSDLIIVTGNVSKQFARQYISALANTIMKSDFWRNQVEQINVRQDFGIEIVPRVGDHIIFLGYLPEATTQQKRIDEVTAYTNEKLDRLEKFYIYGLKETGWNKYETIDVQFRNQIICKKHPQQTKIQIATPPEQKPGSIHDMAAGILDGQEKKQEQNKKQNN